VARPQKDGVDYFPCDVDIFEDDKIFDVTNELGPLGEVIYIRLLCLIYKNGYYYKFENLDKLASMLIKSIGNKWARDKQSVMQVIPFLAKCNLFSSELMQENVLTSASIQRRYLKATERRQTINNKDYWLLETDNSRIIVTKNQINVYNNPINVYDNPENVDSGTQSKVKESKVNKSKELEVSKKEINKLVTKESARESYDDIFDKMEVHEPLRHNYYEFIKHCQLNGKKLINSKLTNIIIELDMWYKDNDEAKINSLRNAISAGYFDIKENKWH